jgi:flagellar capping protein FliD
MAVTFLKPQMRNFFQSAAEGFVDTIDSFVQASDIGLTFDGAGMMKFDNEIFNDAVNEDFTGVLELLGATASGNSTNSIIQFDSASETYTTAGTYEVKVDINGISEITDVWFKHESESTWRLGTYNSLTGRIAGDDTMDEDNGGPLYDENGLQLVIDMSQVDPNTTYTTTVNVQQGIVGALEDMLSEVLKSGGQFDVSKTVTDDRITAMERRIENEEKRLTRVETRLIAKYARLERILTEMNQQMAAISSMASPY